MNHVTLLGNLTADPETRFTGSGKAVVEWTLAVSKRWRTESGEQKERTSFISCYAWGPKGEAFARFHRKGQKALVEGELVQETWEDKQTGKKQSKTRVNVSEFHFVGGPRPETPDAPRPAPKSHPGLPLDEAKPSDAEAEDDVPF